MDYKLVITLILVAFAVIEVVLGRFVNRGLSRSGDVAIELLSALTLPALVVPAILFASAALTEAVAPGSAGAWSGLHPLAMFGVLLLADDLTQYAWQRLSHRVPALYRLHRAHHSAAYMSVRLVYRNNLFYYALMPGLWLSGVLLHLGFGPVHTVYIVAKMTVIIAAHSSAPWDAPLLRVPALRPVMAVVARVISTPSTHAAHHGKHAADGVTFYQGNYGNFLFLWDVIFGTAHITGRRPERFGIEGEAEVHWAREALWPFGAPAAAPEEAP